MVIPSSSLKAPDPAAETPLDNSVAHAHLLFRTGRNRVLFFLTAWLIVLMPFLFWWGTWFGRSLSDKQMGEYLNDEKHPRHIQHALVRLGDRIVRRDGAAKRWYPDIARLAAHPVEEVRNTDAWVMGQDTASQAFHDTLLKMLQDPAITVRGNAALSLVRFGDASGRSQIVALLQPAKILAPTRGGILDAGKPGAAIRQGGTIAKFGYGVQQTTEVRSPIAGRIRSINVPTGVIVAAGTEVATVDPGDEQVWEALRALYLIGRPDDLPAIRPYERELPDISDRVRQQAALTENVILKRAKQQP
jgi:hypothetical protein